jgi:ABC-type transporter Mla subunit MlaD
LQNLGHSLTSALSDLSDRFAHTLSNSANQEFDQVVNTLGGTARLLEGMNAQFQASQTMLTELVNVARNTTAEQMALGKTQVEELTAVLRGLMTQMHQATDTSVHHITTTLTAVVHDLSTQVTELGQQMSQTVTASAGHATGVAQAVIERADQWSARSAEQLAQLLEKHHSQLDRVQDVQRTLDTTLSQFKGTLGEYATVTHNLGQIATQTSTMVAAASGSTKAIQEAGIAIEHVAQLTAAQVDGFKTVVGSMQHYEEVFRRVEDTAGKLLIQIERHLRNYQETTQEGFDKLTSSANGFITDATQKLGATVNELDEYLQDLTEILGQFRR